MLALLLLVETLRLVQRPGGIQSFLAHPRWELPFKIHLVVAPDM